ncbi:MAG: glyoxalase [Bacteroidetes bacterium]|nr:MAG: glyoxalase [Bacteroidota bacterium]
MIIEHIAIWTNQLEAMRDYYVRFFGGKPNEKYTNPTTGFESFFLTFESGARLELMRKPRLPDNQNDTIEAQHLGIIHIAFALQTKAEVDAKAGELQSAGYRILRAPRTTGDGYYEFETLDPDNNRLEVTALS